MAGYMKRLMHEMLEYDWMNRENNYSKKGGLFDFRCGPTSLTTSRQQ